MTVNTEPAIVPNFDSEVGTGRKIAIICSKGNLDMAYPGLILANAALGEGAEVHMFFTFWGFDMINKKTMGDLKFTMLGNTATHMAVLPSMVNFRSPMVFLLIMSKPQKVKN